MSRTFKPRTSWRVSPSQVEIFRLCQRKWGLRNEQKYVQNIGAFRGEATHKIIGAYGLRGTPPVNSRDNLIRALERRYTPDLDEKGISPDDYADRIVAVAHKMIALLPPPKWNPKFHRVEEKFKLDLDGVPWGGAIDHHYSGVVEDFKVVSSPDFALLEEYADGTRGERQRANGQTLLREDVQANVYAYRKILLESSEGTRLRWVYGLPGKHPRAWTVEQTVYRRDVEERVKKINKTAKKIYHLALVHPDPMSLPPNWDACHKYGGCPFASENGGPCKPSAEDIASTVFEEREQEQNQMGLMKDLKKEKRSRDEDEEVEEVKTKSRSRARDDEDDDKDEEDDEEVAAPRGKTPSKGKKVDKEQMREDAKEDIEQLLSMPSTAKVSSIIEAMQAKYKALSEEEIEELIDEVKPLVKKSASKKRRDEDEEDEEVEEKRPAKKSSEKSSAKVSKISDEEVLIKSTLAKVLRDVADVLSDD